MQSKQEKQRDQGKQSRRQFLWKVGAGLAGLTGLSKLVQAMAADQKPHAVAVPIPPCMAGVTCAPPGPSFHCPALFSCIGGFQCGPSWLGDFECQNDFDCQTPPGAGGQFKCVGSEPGNQFECFISFDCNGANPFWCDPGDFWCNPGPPNQYFCNGAPGGGYVQPPTGCKPLL